MIPFARILFALILAFGLSLPAAARAEDISSADREAIRSMIGSQIEAFRRDDGGAAYSYASPPIQNLYPTVDLFMGMVRQSFQPVYRPQAYTFGPLVETAAGPKLRVFVTGPDGAPYIAEYSFQRQPDGSWKINGCQLLKDTSPTI